MVRLTDLSPAEFAIVVTIAAALSLAVFAHADRHGSRHATAWGIGVFLLAGLVLPLYVVHFWLGRRRRR